MLKQNKESDINLSKNQIQPKMLDIFSLGVNCHLKHKFERIQQKVELELLFEDVKELEKSNKVLVHNEEDLECELERFGYQYTSTYQYTCNVAGSNAPKICWLCNMSVLRLIWHAYSSWI